MKRRSIVSVAALLTALVMVMSTAAAAPYQERPVDPTGSVRAADSLDPVDATAVGATSAAGKATPLPLGHGPQERTYLIRLVEPAVPAYAGGVAGLPRTAPEPGEKLDAASPPVREYRSHLVEEQTEFVDAMEETVGREVEVPFSYQHAVNGVAAVLTPAEAEKLARHPEVAGIELDVERELHTDQGPVWSGADSLWNAVEELGLPENYRGEGIVIGTIDTGISPGNRSFAETGDDGYTHENPLGDGVFLGACDPANNEQFDPDFPCNNKLIGAYVFGGANDSALDYDGHGSHTASTSGGNVVDDAQIEAPTITTDPVGISGVAPHANVISYLGCCTVAGLTASIDQAIADGVDVINYSIGSSDPGDPWTGFDTVGFLNARAAGVFVATSNGNDGPGDATTGSPASAPWLTTVGASTHDRKLGNAATNLTSSAGDLPDITGKSITSPLPATPILYAGDFGSPECGSGDVDNPVNDWEPGTFDGQIVVCDRGSIGRIQKSVHVLEAGGGGIIHANDAGSGDSLNADAFAVPGVHITFDDGQVLKDWLDNGADDHSGAIRGTAFEVDDAFGDVMAAFSSRGPNRAIDRIVPDVTAPGVDILAAIGADSATADQHGVISGTSMASPHVAGAGALLVQVHPDWTPAQIQSALMTTGRDVLNHDGAPATAYAQGAGHINVDQAVRAGLLFDETIANYQAANPADGGDPRTLNLPSLANTQCLAVCSWDRTATVPDSAPGGVTWTASVTGDDGLELAVALSPDPAALSPGDSLDIAVTADVSGAPNNETLFGHVVLTPDHPDVPVARLPVAVVPVAGALPGAVDIDTRRDAGSELVSGIESIDVTDFTGAIQGFVPGTVEESALVQDPTNGSPYDNLDDVDVFVLDVPDGATRLAAEVIEAEMPDLDLYVGTGAAPSEATEVCSSTSPASAEACDVLDPAAGSWWVLVQNWEGTAPDAADAYTLATAVVPGESAGNGGVDGPDGPIPSGQPYDIRIHWDIPELAAGERWYGTAVLGSSPDTPGNIGSFPVTVRRAADDVTKTADVEEAAPGEVVTYEIEVAPNVTPEDLEYTITDTIPEGLTYVDGSATGGATVADGVVSWTGVMPTAAGLSGSYQVATSATDPSCDTPFGGYFDLREAGIFPQPGVTGDSVAFTAFADGAPFQFYGADYAGMGFSDDGFAVFDPNSHYGGEPWEPQAVPDPAQPNNLIGALWHDFEIVYDEATDRGVSLALTDDGPTGLAVVDYRGVQRFGDDSGETYTFQVVMQRQPTPGGWQIFVAYDELGPLGDPFTVAVENADGSEATELINQDSAEDTIAAGTVVCYAFEPAVPEPHVITYQATVDPDAAPGVYTNQAVHTTDDPYAQEATAAADVQVTGGAVTAITVEPDRFVVRAEQTQQLTATGHLADGGTVDLTESVTWATGNPLLLTVDDAGLVTGLAGGTTEVTATLGELSGTATARVAGRPPEATRPPLITTDTLPEWDVLAPYEAALEVSYGFGPFTWSATGLPDGLTLDPETGVISNDPDEPPAAGESTTVVVTVTDALDRVGEAELTLDITGVTQVSAGWDHTCAATADGAAYCWGANFAGQLGDGSNDDSAQPVRVAGPGGQGELADVVEITTGWDHSCARTADGAAYCWGANFAGQLGNGDSGLEADRNAPVAVQDPAGDGLLTNLAQISGGALHTCAATTGGDAYCWGSNGNGRLGDGTTDPSPLPVPVTGLAGAVQIHAAAGHSCALVDGGDAYCWGSNASGRLGDGTTTNSPVPVQVVDLADLTQISGGDAHTCAVTAGGDAYCWGSNFLGRLGDGTTANSPVPVQVVGLDDVAQISAGAVHVCATTVDGDAYCWGSNGSGRLGDGGSDASSVPVQVEVSGVAQINAGDSAHTCAAVAGAVWCWGNNGRGQLGNGTQTSHELPAPVHPGEG